MSSPSLANGYTPSRHVVRPKKLNGRNKPSKGRIDLTEHFEAWGQPNELAGWRRRDKGRVEYLIQQEYFQSAVCEGLDPDNAAHALQEAGLLKRRDGHWTVRVRTRDGMRDMYCVLDSILMATGV